MRNNTGELSTNPLIEFLQEKREKTPEALQPFSPDVRANLDAQIAANLVKMMVAKMKDTLTSYSVEKQRSATILKIRHQLLMALRFPSIVDMATDGTSQRSMEADDYVTSQVEASRQLAQSDSNQKETTISNFSSKVRGIIFLDNLHEFPILLREANNIFQEFGIRFPNLADWGKAEHDMKHEMGHLLPVLLSEGSATPLIGIEIFQAYKDNVRLGWGYRPVSSYNGTLTFGEYKLFRAGRPDDMAENDAYAAKSLESLDK
jgi:hypothetical protein